MLILEDLRLNLLTFLETDYNRQRLPPRWATVAEEFEAATSVSTVRS